MTRLLIINDESIASLIKVKEYAENNRLSIDDLLDIMNKNKISIADTQEHHCIIPDDFMVSFSIEEWQPGEFYRHASISTMNNLPGRVPNPPAINLLISYLGFAKSIEYCHVKLRDDVVHIAEKISK